MRIRVKLSGPRVFISEPASLSSNEIATDLRNKYFLKADSNPSIMHRFHQPVPVSQYCFCMLVELVDVRVHDRASQDIFASYQRLSYR